MRHSSMTSFAVAIEPAGQPRLAAIVLAVHLAAAAFPWLARAEPVLAAALSILALAGLVPTLARLPGRHCPLAAISVNARGCRARLTGGRGWTRAALGPGARAYASVLHLELVIAGRRRGWLLPRGSIPDAEFRRLKVWIRLSC
jgi:hypothetical protein